MTARPLLGIAACLLPACAYARAEIRIGTNGTAYLHCSKCTTTVRTASRTGDIALRALVRDAASPLAAAGDAILSPRPAMRTRAHRRRS